MKNKSLAILVLLSAGSALADVGVSNISQGASASFSFVPNISTPYGSPFTTGPLTYKLDSVDGLFNNSGPGLPVPIVSGSIYTDNGGNIGTQLISLSDFGLSGFVGNETAHFNDYNTDFLQPNTTYWFVVSTGLTSNPNVNEGISMSPDLDSSLPGWSKPNQLEFVGQSIENNVNVPFTVNVTPVPEVSSFGYAAAVALGGFALIRRRKTA